jgi:LysR family transcriptional regulator, transcriptional activator for bauABCD operon
MPRSRNLLPRKLGDSHIRLLRIYKSVVECGGFAATEIELNISRPAISMAITELESLLDIRLCNRGRSGFSVTDEGVKVYEATLQLLSGLENFRTQVNTIKQELRGELNIGITDNLVTFPKMRVTRSLTKLKDRGPEVVINIRMMPPNQIETGILDGQLQIGVVPDLRRLPDLNYIPLYKEKSLLYCSREHPLFEQDNSNLSDTELAAYDSVLPAYPQAAEIKQQQKVLSASASSTDREGVAFLILSGRYLGFLPTHFAQRWVKEGEMCAVQPEKRKFITHYSAITRKAGRPNYVLEVFLEELLKEQ